MFSTVIWATDGSQIADEALPFAKALVEREGGKLVVVHSNELFFSGRATGLPVHADERELETKIESQVKELRSEGIDASLQLVTGVSTQAAHMIADAAREVGADVTVVGTRGHGPVAGVLVGSVTQRLLHVAPCPVLAVPPARKRSEKGAKDEQVTVAG